MITTENQKRQTDNIFVNNKGALGIYILQQRSTVADGPQNICTVGTKTTKILRKRRIGFIQLLLQKNHQRGSIMIRQTGAPYNVPRYHREEAPYKVRRYHREGAACKVRRYHREGAVRKVRRGGYPQKGEGID
jgi:hypothetical protein